MPYRDPARQRRAKAESARRARAAARGGTGGGPWNPIPAPVRLETALDALALVREEIANVRAAADVSAPDRARCVGYLLSVGLRAIEAGNLELRLEALEAALAARPRPAPVGAAS